MTTLLCQVTLLNANAIPADAAVNTWHFKSLSVDRLDDATYMTTQLQNFYDALDSILGEQRSGDMTFKWYDLVDPAPRAPILTVNSSMAVTAGTKLPNEVAICMSYHAAPVSGTPIARRRGRIYLGPWNATVMAETTGDAVVASGTADAIAAAGQALIDAGTADTYWVVFSPTTAGAQPWGSGDLTAASLSVINGHVDNAFDTVRSRGAAATDRVPFD